MLQTSTYRMRTQFDHCVLIVEDEPLILMLIEDTLADLGYAHITGVYSSAAAFAALGSNEVTLAVLDLHLRNGDDSFGVAAWLQEHHVPFVFASGSGGEEVPERFSDIGFVSKPLEPDALASALSQAAMEAISRYDVGSWQRRPKRCPAMPCYFFDINDDVQIEDEGLDLPDLGSARWAAARALAEAAEDTLPGDGPQKQLCVRVRDVSGRVVLTARLTFSTLPPPYWS